MALYRGYIRKLTPSGAWVEIPQLAAKKPVGPLSAVVGDYSIDSPVLVTTVSGIDDDLVIVGKLTPDVQERVLNDDPNAGGIYPEDALLAGAVIESLAIDTANRPDAAGFPAGSMIFDTTLGKPLWSDGTDWRDATGTIV